MGCVLRVYRPLSVVDVMAAVHALPDKQCMSDPLPSNLLKDNVDMLAPFLVDQYNRSFIFKSAFITPLLKKAFSDRVCMLSHIV